MADGNRIMRTQGSNLSRNTFRFEYDRGTVEVAVARQSTEPEWEEPVEVPQHEPQRKHRKVPEPVPERTPKRTPGKYSRSSRQERALQHALAGNLPSLIVVGICLSLVTVSLVNFTGAYGELHNHIKTVTNLKSELSDAALVNDTYYMAVEASIDYTEIFDYAINTLGMTYPGKSQILWYESTESEYVSQYESVPQE